MDICCNLQGNSTHLYNLQASRIENTKQQKKNDLTKARKNAIYRIEKNSKLVDINSSISQLHVNRLLQVKDKGYQTVFLKDLMLLTSML